MRGGASEGDLIHMSFNSVSDGFPRLFPQLNGAFERPNSTPFLMSVYFDVCWVAVGRFAVEAGLLVVFPGGPCLWMGFCSCSITKSGLRFTATILEADKFDVC